MSSITMKEFAHASWNEVYNRIIGASVFIDGPSAECLHWDGGLLSLKDNGAVDVQILSPHQKSIAKLNHKKGVFITQGQPSDFDAIKDVVLSSDFTHCIIICTVGLDAIFSEMNEGKEVSDIVKAGRAPIEAVKQIEATVLEWIGKEKSAAEVVHIPIFTIPLTNNAFLTPIFHNILPTFNDKLIPNTPTIDLYTVNSKERGMLRRIASCINSMLGSMNLKEDVYYMGAYSSLVAGVLENSPVCINRRKNCHSSTSLILIDGTLDLSSLSSHSTESLLDRVVQVLKPFPGHSVDVAVDMSPLCEANVTQNDFLEISPGCIYHSDDLTSMQTFEHMITKSQKEVLFNVYNKLSKIDVHKSPSPKNLLKVTPQSIEKVINASKGNYEVIERYSGVLQQALAIVHTLKSPKYSETELVANLEKQLQQNIATSRESTSVVHQISNLILNRKQRKLTIESLLSLLIHIYSVTGTEISFTQEHELALECALSTALNEDHSSELVTQDSSLEECKVVAEQIVVKLREIANLRKILMRYNSVLKPSETGAGYEHRGVLLQLIDDLVNPSKPEIVDLRHRNEGIKDLLRTGLNILTSKKPKKHPMDNPLVIIFVIGGITADLIAKIHRIVITSGTDTSVIIGSTGFSKSVLKNIWKQ